MNFQEIETFYRDLFMKFGDSPQGVGWNSTSSQDVRIMKLVQHINTQESISFLDIGCGLGRSLEVILNNGINLRNYHGIDMNKDAIEFARKKFYDKKNVTFESRNAFRDFYKLDSYDYIILSGVFNIMPDENVESWSQQMQEVLKEIFKFCKMSLSVNFLSLLSDEDKRKPNHFYCNPSDFLSFALQNLSSRVTILHNYNLWDFTAVIER